MEKDKILDKFNSEEVGVEDAASENLPVPEPEVVAPTPTPTPTPTPEVKDEEIKVSKVFLENLISRIDNLEGKTKQPKKVNEHFAYIRLWKDKVVLGVKRFHTEKALSNINDHDEKRLFAELIIKDSEEKVMVDWLDFLNQIDGENRFKVKIVNEIAQEVSSSQGNMLSRNLDEYNNKKFVTREIDLEVISYQYTCKVQVIDGKLAGQEITLNSESLNL